MYIKREGESDVHKLKKELNQEMRLRYKVDTIGVSAIDSIPHVQTKMLWKGAKTKKYGPYVSI